MTANGTAREKEWQRVVLQRVTMYGNERQQMATSDKTSENE